MIVRLLLGDCVSRMQSMDEARVGWIAADPPYGLEFMGKEWDRLDGVGTGGATFSTDGMGKGFAALPSYSGTPNPLCRNCKGSKRGRDRVGFKVCRCEEPDFPNVGREQGQGMQEWHTRWLAGAFRVLRPGGQVMAFGGTRTFHRLAKAMETVGFTDIHYEAWNYASGFPKNYNVSRAMATEQAKWDGWGTAMKPAWEPVLIGTKPCE